jgi:hypothetical protein
MVGEGKGIGRGEGAGDGNGRQLGQSTEFYILNFAYKQDQGSSHPPPQTTPQPGPDHAIKSFRNYSTWSSINQVKMKGGQGFNNQACKN